MMDYKVQIYRGNDKYTFIVSDENGKEFEDSAYFEGIDFDTYNEAVSEGLAFAQKKMESEK